MIRPQRIQLKRTKGYSLNGISRALNGLPAKSVARPSLFGNPYQVAIFGDRVCVEMFEQALRDGNVPITCEVVRRELKGINLACYCKLDAVCHADVLLKIANEESL